MSKNSISAIVRQELDGGDFTGNYQLLSPVSGIGHACFCIVINNNTNQELGISYDGVNSHDFAAPAQVIKYEFQGQSQPQGFVCKFSSNMQVWVRSVGGVGTGAVYLMGYYQSN